MGEFSQWERLSLRVTFIAALVVAALFALLWYVN